MAKNENKQYTVEDFARVWGWKEESVRQACRRQVDRYGRTHRLPKGWDADRNEFGRWVIFKIATTKQKSKSAQHTGVFKKITEKAKRRMIELSKKQIRDSLSEVIGHGATWEVPPETPEDWEALGNQVTAEFESYNELSQAMAQKLTAYWWSENIWNNTNQEFQTFTPGAPPPPVHQNWWNLWRSVNPTSRPARQPAIPINFTPISQNTLALNLQGQAFRSFVRHENINRVPPAIKQPSQLMTTIQRCYQFATANNRRVQVELSFEADGSWDWQLKEPLGEPLFYVGLCRQLTASFGQLVSDLIDQILSEEFQVERTPNKYKPNYCQYCAKKLAKPRRDDQLYCDDTCPDKQNDWRNKRLRPARRANRWNIIGERIVERLYKLRQGFKENRRLQP